MNMNFTAKSGGQQAPGCGSYRELMPLGNQGWPPPLGGSWSQQQGPAPEAVEPGTTGVILTAGQVY